ncbi:MAG: NAD-dependent epimerase/dehydratase family protein [Bacteroidetes bacterium]|nr:NAD-dependent epimerase/dehydratase family protein [Bacteroidota bacterium]
MVRPKQVLVLGGTRFIGKAAVASLVRDGHHVTIVHRGNTPNTNVHVREIRADRMDRDAVSRIVRDDRYDVLLDMMPLGEADVDTVCSAIGDHVPHVVAISSIDVYHAMDVINKRVIAEVNYEPITETSKLRERLYPYRDVPGMPASLHDYDKILAERRFLQNASDVGTACTVIRLPAVYGIDDYQRRVQSLLDVMDGTDTIDLPPTFASFRMSRSSVNNVGDAICLACTQEHPGTYVFAEPTAFTELQWHQMVAKAAGWQGTISVDASQEDATDFDGRQHCVVDASLFRTMFTYTERQSVEDALHAIVQARQ